MRKRIVVGGWLVLAGLLSGVLSGVLYGQHAPLINTGPRGSMIPPANASPYGNILFPGGTPSHAQRLGANLNGRILPNGPYPGGPQHPGRPGGVPHPGRNRTIIVPYAYPVYVENSYPYPQPQNITVIVPPQVQPSVIINHYGSDVARTTEVDRGDARSGVQVFESPARSAPREAEKQVARIPVQDQKATIYLLALRDGSLKSAIGYWTEDTTLHYVTQQGTVNRVTLDMFDRDQSIRLNRERGVELELRGN